MLGSNALSENPISALSESSSAAVINTVTASENQALSDNVILRTPHHFVTFNDDVAVSDVLSLGLPAQSYSITPADQVTLSDTVILSLDREAMRIRTITLTPGFLVQREAITMTSVVDFDSPGNFGLFNRGQRPAYKFQVTADALVKHQADSLNAFHFFHQGGRAFYWNGCDYGFVSSLQLAGEGNGAQKDFFCFNRNIDAASFSVAIDNPSTGTRSIMSAAFSLNPIPGIVSLTTAPSSEQDVYICHAHKYKVVFEPDGLKQQEFAPGVYRSEMTLREII